MTSSGRQGGILFVQADKQLLESEGGLGLHTHPFARIRVVHNTITNKT